MGTKANSVREPVASTIPTQAPVVMVRQEELVKFIGLRNQIAKLEEQKELMETELKNLLTSGAPVEEGIHIAKAELSERRTPAWKEEYIDLAEKLKGAGQGEKMAQKVIDSTEPKIYTKLTVK